MSPRRTADRSPIFKLIRNERGWYKHVPGVGTKYVCSVGNAPTGEDADEVFRTKFPELSQIRSVTLETMSVQDMLDLWLAQPKMEKVSAHTLSFYRWVAEKFAEVVGPTTPASSLTKAHAVLFRDYVGRNLAPSTIKNRFTYIKQALRFAAKHRFVRPDFWADVFNPPTQKEHREHRAKRQATTGSLAYTAAEIRKLLKTADKILNPYPLKLWTLLGINGGLGQSDLDGLTRNHYEPGRLVFPRPKTSIPRVVPLWPETEKELKAWLAKMPPDRDKLFVSVTGLPSLHGASQKNIVTKQFRELCNAAGVRGRGHYSLRRTMRTLVDELPDRHAIDIVMGHEEQDVGRRYVQGVAHARLVAITEHVRDWLTQSEAPAAESESGRSGAARPARARHSRSAAQARRG